jgi:NitT/TauT family transport system substrate-binding protein
MKKTCLALIITLSSLQLASSAELTSIKIAVGQKGVGETMVPEIGQQKGIFQKHGLNLDIFYTAGSGETIQAIVGNSAQIGVATGLSGAIGAYARGAPLRIIGATFTGDTNLFWYVKADSKLNSPGDADGKTIAYSTNGSSTHNAVLQMQKYAHVHFKLTATGSAPATFTQVMSDQIDVGWSGAPFAVEALEQGRIKTLWRASDIPAVKGMTSRVMVANADYMKDHPAVTTEFLAAYRETLDLIYHSPEGAQAYADWADIPLNVAQRTLRDFVSYEATNPDEIMGLDQAMNDAVNLNISQPHSMPLKSKSSSTFPNGSDAWLL